MRRRWITARGAWLIPLAAFAIAVGTSSLFGVFPYPFATLAWKLFWMVVVFGALRLQRRTRLVEALETLGLRRPARAALGWMFLATLPMLLILAMVSRAQMDVSTDRFLLGVLVGPATEEILFRGYLFRQLYRSAGWRFWTSVLVTSMVFGAMHLPVVLANGAASEIFLELGITALGGAFFAWLFVRWGDDLWVPIVVHTSLNLWWELFGAGATAVGDTWANVARACAVAGVIVITLWKAPPGRAPLEERARAARVRA